jgi:uridine kinase
MTTISDVVTQIQTRRDQVPAGRALLVALSGIDGSGKGYLSSQIADRLTALSIRTALLHLDGWLNLPPVRFGKERPGEHFYEHAFRFEEMFARLVLPLRQTRSIHLVADFTEETAIAYRPHTYQFEDIEVILLEGIFLLKPAFRNHYDLTVWIDCTFETALERALQRGQEDLPESETIQAYQTIFFPAQRVHFDRDNPRAAAELIVINDPRLET